MDHTRQLGTAPILRLVLKFSVPTIIAMTINAIYNLIDRVFVGQYVGEFALGGLIVSFPLMIVGFAIGTLFAIGGATLISIKFGEHKPEEANKIFGNVATLILISSILMTILGEIFLTPLLHLAGATKANFPYAESFMRIILIGLVFQLSSFTMAAIVRSEGKPFLSMISQIISALVNIVLDYFFFAVLKTGVEGAAIATVIGQLVGFCILFRFYFISKKSLLKITLESLKLRWQYVRQIMLIGASSFVINVGTGISAAITNGALLFYDGDAAVTSYGAINAIFTLVLMPVLGLLQGIGPIMGYNHGMRQPSRVWRTLWTGIGLGCIFTFTLFALLELFPEAFASLFLDPSSPTMPVCAYGIRLTMLALPVLSFSVLSTAYFQSTAQGKKSFFISLLRQLLVIVGVLVLPQFLQLSGVWLAGPFSELLSLIVASLMLIFDRRAKRQELLPAEA